MMRVLVLLLLLVGSIEPTTATVGWDTDGAVYRGTGGGVKVLGQFATVVAGFYAMFGLRWIWRQLDSSRGIAAFLGYSVMALVLVAVVAGALVALSRLFS